MKFWNNRILEYWKNGELVAFVIMVTMVARCAVAIVTMVTMTPGFAIA